MTTIASDATIVRLFCDRVAASGDRPAVLEKRGDQFAARTWNELAHDVARHHAALVSLGVVPGDRVVLVAPNRYEWVVFDLAIQLAGSVHVPAHNSLAGEQIAWQVRNCDARLIVVAGDEQLDKLAECSTSLPDGVPLYSLDETASRADRATPRIWREVLPDLSLDEALRQVAACREQVPPDALATILYTSGTTGDPKGVMLSQNNLAFNALATIAAFEIEGEDLRLGWLPLSHIFARTCDLYTGIAVGCQLALSAGPLEVIGDCALVRPTLLNGVPYFFEKVQRKLTDAGLADQAGILPQLFGGRMRAICSGGAALPDHVDHFFNERGVLLVQGYGLTETSPVITAGTRRAHRTGTVGRAIPGVEVRIAEDGEIMTRGPHVMLGYWKRPDATAEVLRDGWFHTGDLGSIDDDGFLRITGRKKDLIVTTGGKNVAPAVLEALLVADELIQQAVVVGDGRNYLTALIVPNRTALEPLLGEQAIDVSDWPAALRHPAVLGWYRQRIDQRLHCVSTYEQVGKFILLDREFSIEQGELTPTLKLRRGVVYDHFARQIEALYNG